jgi:hypothetical protein
MLMKASQFLYITDLNKISKLSKLILTKLSLSLHTALWGIGAPIFEVDEVVIS